MKKELALSLLGGFKSNLTYPEFIEMLYSKGYEIILIEQLKEFIKMSQLKEDK